MLDVKTRLLDRRILVASNILVSYFMQFLSISWGWQTKARLTVILSKVGATKVVLLGLISCHNSRQSGVSNKKWEQIATSCNF